MGDLYINIYVNDINDLNDLPLLDRNPHQRFSWFNWGWFLNGSTIGSEFFRLQQVPRYTGDAIFSLGLAKIWTRIIYCAFVDGPTLGESRSTQRSAAWEIRKNKPSSIDGSKYGWLLVGGFVMVKNG